MDSPDARLFEADVRSARFRNGVVNGWWDLADADIADTAWPARAIWISAAARTGAPDRFFLLIDLTGYRANAPTGTFWDPATESMLAVAKRPKGRPGSRCEKVFRTDWKNGRAFYHPYDRVAAGGHPNWARKYPHLVWSIDCTIVDYLLQFHALLNSGNYIGI